MFYNNVACDIYIGKGAGKKLLQDIQKAKYSVNIVSPYLSPFLIKELIDLHGRGIEINLITTDNIEDYYGDYEKNIHKLILQDRWDNKKGLKRRDELAKIMKILLYSMIGLGVASGVLAYFVPSWWMLLSILPLLVILFFYRKYQVKKRNTAIYHYRYSQLFPFKVYMSPDASRASKSFIHCKVYIIDNKIAYLGSLNFTKSGIKHNYESRVRITDPEAVAEIKKEFKHMFYHSDLPERNIQNWGKALYGEPKNS